MTSTAAEDAARRAATRSGWRRWAGPLLLVSLMANLLVLGALAGSFFATEQPGPLTYAPIDRGLIGYIRSLPEARRHALFTEMEPEQLQLKEARKTVWEARRAALAAFAADPLDEARLKEAIAAADRAEGNLQAVSSTIFVSVASKLTPAERRGLKEWREARQPRLRGDHHHPKGGRHDKPR